jgi:hypothetical protein
MAHPCDCDDLVRRLQNGTEVHQDGFCATWARGWCRYGTWYGTWYSGGKVRRRVLVLAGVSLVMALAGPVSVSSLARPVTARASHAKVAHKKQHHRKRRKPRVIRKDGPGCPAWTVSLPCVCPKHIVREATGEPGTLPAGDGWVEITLTYSTFGAPSPTCPGGIAIENSSGAVVASAGYSAAAHTGLEEGSGGAPGVAPGSVTTFALSPGSWTAISDDQRVATSSETFTIVAGQATKLSVVLKS